MIEIKVCGYDDMVDDLITTMQEFYELDQLDPTIEGNIDSYILSLKGGMLFHY